MSLLYVQVPLGIFLKGEQKYEDMVQVLDHLHQYVPTISSEECVTISDSQQKTAVNDTFHKIGLGES